MSVFKGSYYLPFGMKKDRLDDHLSSTLSELRRCFVFYKKRKSLGENTFIDQKTKELYNQLTWKFSRNKIVIDSNKKYLEYRANIFKEYYEIKNGNTFDDYNPKKNQFLFFDYDSTVKKEIRHTLQKTIVVHKFEFDYFNSWDVYFHVIYEKYCRRYLDYCLKQNCFNDAYIKKVDPSNILKPQRYSSRTGQVQKEMVELLIMMEKSMPYKDLSNYIKIRKFMFLK